MPDLTNVTIRILKQSDILRCPHVIFAPDHYREDGTCKCDDADERKRLRKFGYRAKDFAGVPLREKGRD